MTPNSIARSARLAPSQMSNAGRLSTRTVVALTFALLAAEGAAQLAEVAEICSGELLSFDSPPFERFDRNADERLTANEVQDCAALDTVFSRLDLDADQALTRAEYRGFADVWRRRRRAFGQDVD